VAFFPARSPITKRITKITRKMKKSVCAMSTAPAAIPENPKTAAIMAIQKKIAAHFKNIIGLPSLSLKRLRLLLHGLL
jgi:hypothetical protein